MKAIQISFSLLLFIWYSYIHRYYFLVFYYHEEKDFYKIISINIIFRKDSPTFDKKINLIINTLK